MADRLSPACCCTYECVDVTYLPADANWADLETAEGSLDDVSTPNRWVMADGDVAKVSGSILDSRAESWFHVLHVKKGGLDLKWNGVTIAFRPSSGTVSVGANSAPIISNSSLWSGWEDDSSTFGTYITLHITPDWFSVWCARRRAWSSSGFGQTQSRGSVQTIDRDNTSADGSLEIVAVGEAEIVSWRFADSTVIVSGGYEGEIASQCSRPNTNLAPCTERMFDSQDSSSTDFSGDFEDHVKDGSLNCVFDSSATETLQMVSDPGYPDSVSVIVWFDYSCSLTLAHLAHPGGPWGRIDLDGHYEPGAAASLGVQFILPLATAATPYGKPVGRFGASIEMVGYPYAISATSDIQFDADGFASGSLFFDSTGNPQNIKEWLLSSNPNVCNSSYRDPYRFLVDAYGEWHFD